jgi:hypothetical protein
MPFSLDPQPKEDEIECGRCGALIYYGLTRCPECGVNLYEPEEEVDEDVAQERGREHSPRKAIFSRLEAFFRRLTRRPYSAEEVFGDALDQASLYGELLRKVGGDHQVTERLIQFEQTQSPDGNRYLWIQNAIRRWERDNRTP